jgi:hypothetical protein
MRPFGNRYLVLISDDENLSRPIVDEGTAGFRAGVERRISDPLCAIAYLASAYIMRVQFKNSVGDPITGCVALYVLAGR